MSVEISITDQIVEINEVSNPVEISVSAGAALAPVWGNITGTLSNQTDLQLVLDGKVPYTGATANVNLGVYNLTASSLIVDTSGQATTFTNFYPATTLGRNIFIGGGGLNSVRGDRPETASYNTALGYNSLLSNTSGNTNTAIGYLSLTANTTGNGNTGLGYISLEHNTTGLQNTALGYQVLRLNTSGNGNTAIGTNASSQGVNANTTGSNNIFIGNNSVGESPTESNRTFIGNINTTSSWLGGKLLLGSRVDASSDTLQVTGSATISSSGSGNTATITHSSGSGIGLNITKGGNGEGLYINKTSGSGNAATIIGTLNATTLVKSGGTSTQYLMADGSVSTLTNPITGTGTSGQVAYWSGTSTQAGNNNLFWDNTNGRLGIGTNVPSTPLQVNGNIYSTSNIRFDTTIRDNRDNAIISQSLSSVLTNRVLTIGNATYVNVNIPDARLLLGTTTDSGQRLQVTGDTLLKGGGGTNVLLVENSDGSDLIKFANNGWIDIGNAGSGASMRMFPFTTTYGVVDLSGRNLQLLSYANTQSAIEGAFYFTGINFSQTSGAQKFINIANGFAPTSGTATFALLNLSPAINQTGGANGITRGLYIQPTLTAAADWRSIEWSNNTGWGLYGAGTSNNYLNGSLGIGSTTLANYALRIGKAITGNAASVGVGITSTISSDVTSSASIYYSLPSTQAATFTLSDLRHYEAGFLTLGSGSTITNQSGFFAGNTLTQATNNFGFYGNIASGTGRWNLYMNGTANNYMNGALLLGSTTSSGQKLQVTGDTLLKGSGATSATTALLVQDSGGTTSFEVLNDGISRFRTSIRSTTGGTQLNQMSATGTGTENGLSISLTQSPISGERNMARLAPTFQPTSGTATLNGINLVVTINQTGGANGITRGLYIQPTLTAAADWRAIEVSAGISVLAPSTTASATLRIPSGTAPTTPNDGDIWFDGTNLRMRIGGVTKTFTLI